MAKKRTTTSNVAETTSMPPTEAPFTSPESKKARLIGMLSQPDGSTIAAIGAALGWQGHTVRAAITGLRKARYAVETAKPADGAAGLIYRITPKPDEKADGAAGAEAVQ